MKRFYLLAAALAVFAFPAVAAQQTITEEGAFTFGTRDKINDNFDELYAAALEGTAALNPEDIAVDDDLTVGDDAAVTDSLTAEDAVITRTPSADSATTNRAVSAVLTSPVDTTGTNTHSAFGATLTIGNASGGTNTVNGFALGAVTGDAQVNVNGLNISTGTVLGTSYAVKIDSGWDDALNVTLAPAADGGQTVYGANYGATIPVHTTGTNTLTASNIALTVGNATGGTNTVNGWNFANYTGDAQVNVNAINIGTSDGLGTANALSIGAGWDAGISTASKISNTLAPSADSATTNTASTINFTTPVDTTGTNAHNGLVISGTIGNATAGTNTFDAIEISAITGDAQVTETAIKIGSGFDAGIVTDGSVKINSTNGTALSAIRLATDTDLDSGQTSEVVTVTGATSASLCFATITIDSSNEVSVTNVVAGTDQATVQVSGDPGASGADLAVICFN